MSGGVSLSSKCSKKGSQTVVFGAEHVQPLAGAQTWTCVLAALVALFPEPLSAQKHIKRCDRWGDTPLLPLHSAKCSQR